MILSRAIPGVAFGSLEDGDARSDVTSRLEISHELGIPSEWATISQVHGDRVVVVDTPGPAGEADALVTTTAGVPIAVATADCVPIAIAGSHSIAIVHAGWRGVAAGVIGASLDAIRATGDEPTAASIGPHIGSCCYEVGDEVVAAVGHQARTTWGTTSVDLATAARDQLGDIPIEDIDICTMDDEGFASYRRNGTMKRQVAVAWLP